MLSYQHVFHAGNRADVLKHAILHHVLSEASKVGGQRFYVETHAARGVYDLTSAEAVKGDEHGDGVGALMAKGAKVPRPLKPWVRFVSEYQSQNGASLYPGSPAIATSLLPKKDRMTLFELHPQEFKALSGAVSDDERVQVRKADGYRGALSLSPRAREHMMVLIDPSYETERDLEALIDWVPRALRRWPTATILVWLPLFKDEREGEFGAFLSELEQGGIAGARWPEDPNSKSSLAGTAMIAYRVPEPVIAAMSGIAGACETFWAGD